MPNREEIDQQIEAKAKEHTDKWIKNPVKSDYMYTHNAILIGFNLALESQSTNPTPEEIHAKT